MRSFKRGHECVPKPSRFIHRLKSKIICARLSCTIIATIVNRIVTSVTLSFLSILIAVGPTRTFYIFTRSISSAMRDFMLIRGVFVQQSTNKLKLLALATPNNEFRLRANRPAERSKKYCVSESITRLKIHLIQIYLAQIKIFFPPKPKFYA